MNRIAKYAEFVKGQGEFHQRQAAKFANDPKRQETHARTSARFFDLLEYLAQLESGGGPNPASIGPNVPTAQRALTLSWAELQNLPPDLMQELSISEADKLDYTIAEVIDSCGGFASLDRLLVELYRKSGEVHKRTTLNSRLYRMAQKGMIHAVAGKKGVYSSRPMSEEEATRLTLGHLSPP
jgi:hypothetical protein